MLNAFVEPLPRTLSLAMHRVANALAAYAPPDVKIVSSPAKADFQVLHTIGLDVRRWLHEQCNYAVIQYCHYTADGQPNAWQSLWERARVVWSYYDLTAFVPDVDRFYYAPLGVDGGVFGISKPPFGRHGVMTSGYVSGPGAEAIEEVALAANRLGLRTYHLGPRCVQGMTQYPERWESIHGITDRELAAYYNRCLWSSGLRHVEGFEFPVIEGLACGARPIVFDRAETRQWFDGQAVFVRECDGAELVDVLCEALAKQPEPVTFEERAAVLEKFSWQRIAQGFWDRVLRG